MNTYDVTFDLAGFSRKCQWMRRLFAGGLSAALDLIASVVWPSSMSSGHLLVDVIEAVVFGVLFAFLFVALMNRNFNYKVIISDDCITAIHPMYKRSVRSNEVKTVAESDGNILTPPSLRISKYGRFGTWLWGCIWIPRTLHDYEYIRNLALTWKGQSQG